MNRRGASLSAALALLASGCAGRPIPPTPTDPRPLAGYEWSSPVERGHPLVGYVLAVREERWVDLATLEGAVAAAEYVFLGEIHDNADHHRLQAELLRSVVGSGRRPALAFEMLDTSLAPALAEAARPGASPEAIAEATQWKRSGWPDFASYRPIFEVGLAAGLELVAANLPRSVAREAVRKGLAALPEDVRQAMERVGEPTEGELRTWAQEMEENHCGELEPALLTGLVRAQRARDAQMTLRIAAAGEGGRGAVLVTGGGHARTDRGVPAWLERLQPGARSVSVGIVEVDADLRRPRQYAEEYGVPQLPFDFVIFTPRAEREDPCEELRRHKRESAAKGR